VKLLGTFQIFLIWTFVAMAVGEEHNSATNSGSFVILKQADGKEFRAFVAGPAEAKVGVLVVHDYFGISEATQESVKQLGGVGYRVAAVDLYGGKSATTQDQAMKLMQSLDRETTDKVYRRESTI
jgi:dienelactone hydrolase